MKRTLEIVAVAYAALSVVETIAGAGAALILIGEAAKWWNLL